MKTLLIASETASGEPNAGAEVIIRLVDGGQSSADAPTRLTLDEDGQASVSLLENDDEDLPEGSFYRITVIMPGNYTRQRNVRLLSSTDSPVAWDDEDIQVVPGTPPPSWTPGDSTVTADDILFADDTLGVLDPDLAAGVLHSIFMMLGLSDEDATSATNVIMQAYEYVANNQPHNLALVVEQIRALIALLLASVSLIQLLGYTLDAEFAAHAADEGAHDIVNQIQAAIDGLDIPEQAVASVFGRTGSVAPADGDYDASLIVTDPTGRTYWPSGTRLSGVLVSIDDALTYQDNAIISRPTTTEMNTAITAAIASLVNGAPGILDTLGEIATAIQDADSALDGLISVVNGKQDASDELDILAGQSSTTYGRAVMTAASYDAIRTLLGLGTSATLDVPASGDASNTQVVKGNDSRLSGNIRNSLVDAKGDLLVGTADDTPDRLAVGSDGTVPVADANSVAGMMWAQRPMTHIFKTGQYTSSAASGNTQNLTNNRLYYVPIFVPKRMSFDRIAINHSSGASSTGVIRLGLYNSGSDDLPGALHTDYSVAVGTLDPTTGTGIKFLSISTTLNPGMYWLACVAQFTGTAPTLSAGIHTGIVIPSADNIWNGTKMEAGVSGALPSSATVQTTNVTNPPMIALRAS